MIFLERRAERHYRELMLPKLFEAWQQSTAEEKLVEQERLRVAQEFYPMLVNVILPLVITLTLTR